MKKFLIIGLMFCSQSLFAGMKSSLGVDAYIQAPQVKTYSASSTNFSPASNATDMCVIGGIVSGLSNQVVKVNHVRVWGTQSTGGINGFYIIKRSAFDTGAMSTLTAVAHDSSQVASGADMALYKANPTLGATVGIVRGSDVFIGASTGLSNSYFDFDFSPASGTRPIILHANEQLALSGNGTLSATGLQLQCEFNWTEEP